MRKNLDKLAKNWIIKLKHEKTLSTIVGVSTLINQLKYLDIRVETGNNISMVLQ